MEQENKIGAEVDAPVMTFDEILEDKIYQSEYDRRLRKASETAVENAKKKWEEEQKIKMAEADKLAKMDEEQKKSYELEQANNRALAAESKLNAYELQIEAIRQAGEKGVDLELMQTLDYTKETAESISKKIEIFERSMRKTHEKAIEEYSKEPTPQTGDHTPTTKSLSDCKSYEDFDNYYKENSKK